MRIGIIGSGNVGGALARVAVRAGHEVAMSNSRGPALLEPLVAQLGSAARAVAVEEAARFGELSVEAIPFGRLDELPAELFAGRVLVSAANYFPARDGPIDFGALTQTGFIARSFPDATVVKCFNAIRSQHLRDEGEASLPIEQRRAVFLAGDDVEAKAMVTRLVESIGFGPVDVGRLEESRILEPGAHFFAREVDVAAALEELRLARD